MRASQTETNHNRLPKWAKVLAPVVAGSLALGGCSMLDDSPTATKITVPGCFNAYTFDPLKFATGTEVGRAVLGIHDTIHDDVASEQWQMIVDATVKAYAPVDASNKEREALRSEVQKLQDQQDLILPHNTHLGRPNGNCTDFGKNYG